MAKRWDSEEETLLKNIYQNNSKKEILEKINRAWPQIRVKANELQLKRDSQLISADRKIKGKRSDAWSKEEFDLLKEIFPNNTKKLILETFVAKKFARSWQSIYVNAKKMGIRRDENIIKQEMINAGRAATIEDKWGDEENELLKKYYADSLQSEIEKKLPKRTFRAIRGQALKLGLSRNKGFVDRDRALHLEEHYNIKSTWQLNSVKEKSKQTNLEKIGVEYPTQSDKVRNKIKQTVQNRYGVDNVFQSPEIKKQIEQTNIENFGVKNPNQSPEIRQKTENTNMKKYGVKNVFQSKEIQNKCKESLYRHGTQRCSAQQAYISNLVNGKINYPVDKCNVDILLKDKICCEYNGGGHYIKIKLNAISEKDFCEEEKRRDFFLKSRGYSIIKIISKKDKLPQDEIIIKMLNEAQEYLKQNHSWINFDIDNNKIQCKEFEKEYDFGILRKIDN